MRSELPCTLATAVLAAGFTAAPAAAQSTAAWEVSLGAVQRRLVERADDGDRLVRESGPLLRLALAGELALAGGGVLRGEAGVAAGTLDYEGRTQAGVALATDTRHHDLDLALSWRPWGPARWGEVSLVLRAAQQRRKILSTSAAGGLDETSTLLMPGLRWSHAFGAGGWRWRPAIELRTSAWHRLEVDYLGVYDAQTLRGGHRRELLLALEASPASSAWTWALEWAHARQRPSESGTVRRFGVPAGTVRQPAIEIDDVTLRLRRAF